MGIVLLSQFIRELCHELNRRGRWGGGNAYKDTPQVRPCRLGLGFLPRTVLVGITATPAST